MTSPYLNRPIRPLSEVLQNRGLTHEDLDEAHSEYELEGDNRAIADSPLRRFSRLMVFTVLFLVLCVGGGLAFIFVALNDVDRQQHLEAEAERLNFTIVPAAGHNGH